MKLEATYKIGDRYARVESLNHDLENWDETYVSFSGYFGKFKPELFAAAPDLYEALEMALAWLDYEGRYDVQVIRAALAKARGEQ